MVPSIYQYTELIRQPGLARHMWTPSKPAYFKLFLPNIAMSNYFDGACSNCELFSEKLFRVWKAKFTSTTFQIIPVAS